MKKLINYWSILIALIFVGVLAIYLTHRPITDQIESHPKLTFSENDIKLVKTLKSQDGSALGDLYVAYSGKTTFTTLLISKVVDGKNIVIYKADKDGLFNRIGQDVKFVNDNFYGYEFYALGDDYFIFHRLSNEGKDVSDDLRVEWNNDKKVFKVAWPQANGSIQ